MTRARQAARAVDEHGPGLTTTVIVVAVLACTTLLAWAGKVNGDAFVSLASAIIGGVLVARGIASGSKATADPPADD